MRATAIACGLFVGLFLPTMIWAQDYDEDDPVRYQWRDRDYLETGQNFGTAYYPRYSPRNSAVRRRYDNRDYGELRYPAVDSRDRYARNYGPPEITRYRRPPVWVPRYDDPDPFDKAYAEPRGPHYIAPDAENFRGGRYVSDYPGFRGGWYGRDHHVRIRAGEYTAGNYANAFWDHQHHVRASPGEHVWNTNSGQAY